MKSGKVLLAVALILLVTGCATNRSVIPIATPDTSITSGEKGSVYIAAVIDNRVFEEAPRDPSIPSLGFGGAAAATDAVKARAIGRKRNGYGKAIGDILLPEGQTVELLIREHAAKAFSDAGWKVVDNANADQAVSIHINEFWAWFKPGFWAITLNSKVNTTLVFVHPDHQVPIALQVEDKRQLATDGAWREIIEMALQAYRRKVSDAMSHP